jgi:hypothetical protein
MRPRHLLGVAVFWGVVGTLGGPTAQAQAATPNSPRAVALFLQLLEKGIKSDTKALNTRDSDIAKLDAATNARRIKQLSNTLAKLHRQILRMTTMLISEATQAFNSANNLSPPNPPLKSRAFGDLLLVQQLSLRTGLGIQPATPMR